MTDKIDAYHILIWTLISAYFRKTSISSRGICYELKYKHIVTPQTIILLQIILLNNGLQGLELSA